MSTAHPETSFRFTYGDYVQWNGDDRWELIDGLLYDMTPAPSSAHQLILSEIFFQVFAALRDSRCKVLLSPFDVRLPDGNEADEKIRTVVQPDLAIVCDVEKIDKAGCRGAPDWVLEILSPSTSSKDQTIKLSLYEKHGVAEYWILDPATQTVTVYQLDTDGRYGPAGVYRAADKVRLSGCGAPEVDLGRVFKSAAL